MEMLILVALIIGVINTVIISKMASLHNAQSKINNDTCFALEHMYELNKMQTKVNLSQNEVNKMLYNKIGNDEPFLIRLENYFRDAGVH